MSTNTAEPHTNAQRLVLAFDTANETVAVALGILDVHDRSVRLLAHAEEQAHRASNTRLLPMVDALIAAQGLSKRDIACVCVGTGPGSFTGVRIALSTAKGIATALGVSLVGVSTLGVLAQDAYTAGLRGPLLVVADAMRKEIYPAYFCLDETGVHRLTPDCVIKAAAFVPERPSMCAKAKDDGEGMPHAYDADGCNDAACAPLFVTGDALRRHGERMHEAASEVGIPLEVLPEERWEPTGRGLLLELERLWRDGLDILDHIACDPMAVLPVYTRLSDAEETERARLADASPRNLATGVQGESTIRIVPFDAVYASAAADLEQHVMGSDAWSATTLHGDLGQDNRSWWMAVSNGELVGYAGGLRAGDDMQLLKIAVQPSWRRRGIARTLMQRLAEDARNLATQTVSLEVRASNAEAQAFYRHLGFDEVGKRPGYYSDGEDAVLMSCAVTTLCSSGLEGLRLYEEGAAGARVDMNAASSAGVLSDTDAVPALASTATPRILAIETSCDETAASVVDGDSCVLSDVVASQIDFHARFGGVVPEIASRKHVEAIVGVTRLALEDAQPEPLAWSDLDAIAVTYAPGLVGALVVGVAFAKGAAWALDIPLIAVNHLEGHLYANRLDPTFAPPAVVSLVSGGNTMLVYMRDWQDYEILGETIDDAVGEAFDKVAKALGLPYPGGPHISRLAQEGNPTAIDFPRALLHSGDYRFSLSGLKTAVMVYIEKVRSAGDELNMCDICASFQQAVIDVQVKKAVRALRETEATHLCIGGGVAANAALRQAYEEACRAEGVTLSMPPLVSCGDNAAMIGLVAQDRFRQGRFMPLDGDAQAHADLSAEY